MIQLQSLWWWSQLETWFSLTNGSTKYKLSKDTYCISQQGSYVSEYYTRMKCVWEELDSMNNLPRLVTITPEMSVFLNSIEKKKKSKDRFNSWMDLMSVMVLKEVSCWCVVLKPCKRFYFSMDLEKFAILPGSVPDRCSIVSGKYRRIDRSLRE